MLSTGADQAQFRAHCASAAVASTASGSLQLCECRPTTYPMPEISRFFGIVIRMFYNDHQPPHFHAEYGEHEA